jgi:hypothetical protein
MPQLDTEKTSATQLWRETFMERNETHELKSLDKRTIFSGGESFLQVFYCLFDCYENFRLFK